MPTLGELVLQFALLSLVAFGGGNAILPELHRVVVEQHHWLSDATFTELFAIAQAAPGPNILVVSLIGLQIAGIAGFFAVTAAFCIPPSLLMFGVFRWWQSHADAAWRTHIQAVVGPLAAGLVLTGGGLILVAATTAGGSWFTLALTAATIIAVLLLPWNPLWWIALGAALGLFGLV
jgi:chromate transporter